MLIFFRFVITLLGTLLFECPWIGIADNTIFNKTCNTSIPQIRERYGDVHTQDGNTLTYVCVGIFVLPMYVAVALPYPRGRGVSRLPCMQMMVWTSSTRLSFVGKGSLVEKNKCFSSLVGWTSKLCHVPKTLSYTFISIQFEKNECSITPSSTVTAGG